MVKVFRKVRRRLLDNGRLQKYLAYALGEILLVVIGILIALQINNANQNRLDEAALSGYLNTIANNIESDVQRAQSINDKRREILPRLSYMTTNIAWRLMEFNRIHTSNYTKDDISFFSETLMQLEQLDYLNPNTSGFESLKSSGFLPKLQESDLEQLIFQYYSLLEQVIREENNFNNTLQNTVAEIYRSDLPAMDVFFNPDWAHWGPENIEEYRPRFVEILQMPTMNQMSNIPMSLIVNYENLIILGTEVHRMISEGLRHIDDTTAKNLKDIYDTYGDIGYPKVLIDGSANPRGFYTSAAATSMNNIQFYQQEFGEIVVDFPATEWGAFYFFNGTGSVEQIRVKDFSVYNTIRLELKGKRGGENVFIGLKDESNPTDGSETKVPLTLTNEWDFYDIPLSSFAPTDLSKLFLVAAIIFENEAATISVRTIQYLR